jgi:drug/metabolite transporter (DMT)-like permease
VAVLVVGIGAVSTAATLIRLTPAPPLVVATYRLLIAAAVLAVPALLRARAEITTLTSRDVSLVALAGAALATHFALWISSLQNTSVASSVVLVTTNPLWVALAAPFVLGERIRTSLALGIGIAFLGGVAIAWGDAARGGDAALGDVQALGGAWAAAAYFLIGRGLRDRFTLLAYVSLVYTVAGAVLLVATIAAGLPLGGYPSTTWLNLFLLALVPQLVGHSSFNWALAHLPATFVAGAVLGEAVGSALLAWAALGEVPPPATVAGGALVIAGLAVAAQGEWRGRGASPVVD